MVRIKAFGSEPGAKEMAEQAMVKVGEAYLTGMQKDDLYKLRDSIVEIKNPSAATGVRKRNKNSLLCVFDVLVCFGFHFHPFQKRTSTTTIAVHFSSVPETAWPQTGLERSGHVFVSRVHPWGPSDLTSACSPLPLRPGRAGLVFSGKVLAGRAWGGEEGVPVENGIGSTRLHRPTRRHRPSSGPRSGQRRAKQRPRGRTHQN